MISGIRCNYLKVLVGVRRLDGGRPARHPTGRSAVKIAPGDFVNEHGIATAWSTGWMYFLSGPLPPEYNATPVCNQEVTEYHELKHSHKMFFDNVGSRYITFDNVFTVTKV